MNLCAVKSRPAGASRHNENAAGGNIRCVFLFVESMNELRDQVVVLAGATGRVGGAALRAFVDAGARVAVVSRSAEHARTAIATYAGDAAERVTVIEADLAVPEGGAGVAREAVKWGGRIDAAVSLAGGGSAFVSVVDSSFDDMQTSVRNNLLVAYNLFVPVLRVMLAQTPRDGARSRGRLVAVTAGSSLDPQPRFGIMGAGKAGVNTFMRAIAREHKADGIVANAVVLGTVATDAAREYLNAVDFAAAAQPEEVAAILAFHASDASTGVNGELIHLNAREVD